MRRSLTTVLWFAAGWALGALLAFVVGVPGVVAPILGLAAGALVAWDPTGALWGPKADRKQIRRRIADLERVPSGQDAAPSVLEPGAD